MSILSLSISAKHTFSKSTVDSIILLKDLGIEGDCHKGTTVQHRSRLSIKPAPQNLRQVHLVPVEILSERQLRPGDLGENIATEGLDLLGMSTGTKLRFYDEGDEAADRDVENNESMPALVLTGLRNPCPQIDNFRNGLKESFIVRDAERKIVGRKAGVMATVERGGILRKGMKILVEDPAQVSPLIPV